MHLNLIVVILLALDAATTIYGMGRKGVAEWHPATRWLVDRIGALWAVLLLHVPLMFFIYFAVMPEQALWLLLAATSVVVENNVVVLWKQRNA